MPFYIEHINIAQLNFRVLPKDLGANNAKYVSQIRCITSDCSVHLVLCEVKSTTVSLS